MWPWTRTAGGEPAVTWTSDAPSSTARSRSPSADSGAGDACSESSTAPTIGSPSPHLESAPERGTRRRRCAHRRGRDTTASGHQSGARRRPISPAVGEATSRSPETDATPSTADGEWSPRRAGTTRVRRETRMTIRRASAAHRRERVHARRAARRARDHRRPARDRRPLLPGVLGVAPRPKPRRRTLARRSPRPSTPTPTSTRTPGWTSPPCARSIPGSPRRSPSRPPPPRRIASATRSPARRGASRGPGAPLAASFPNPTCSGSTPAPCPPGRGRGSHANHPFGESLHAGAPPIRQLSVPSPPSGRSVPCSS
jgi:hypothetical protein